MQAVAFIAKAIVSSAVLNAASHFLSIALHCDISWMNADPFSA